MHESYTDKLYEEYSAQRSSLHSASLEAAGRYDRTVLTVTTGAIALSIAFVEKIASSPHPRTVLFLILSWFLLLVALIFELLSLSSSQKACRQQIDILDLEYEVYLYSEDPETAVTNRKPQPDNVHSSHTRCFSCIALWSLITGITLMMIFSVSNMYLKGDNMPKDKNQKSHLVNTGDKYIQGSYTPEKNKLPPPPPKKKK